MQKNIILKLSPAEAANEQLVIDYIARTEGVPQTFVTGYYINRHSIDARGRQPIVQLSLTVTIREPFIPRLVMPFSFQQVANAPKRVVIVGAGPAGLFAALSLLEAGIRPIILERGKDVRARRRDLAMLNKEGEVNPESNYCFGEGGAGTYSDGKLYTRSSKRGNISRILQLFVHFGAEEKILYEAHPHIGTNKLPQIITAMRQQITECGGEFLFEKKVTALCIDKGSVTGVRTADGQRFDADAVILATGHSARDVFEMLVAQGINTAAKPFALGVRVEHPQSIIDSAQYHCSTRGDFLPPAAYSWVEQVNGKGVFSFCMCPGGIIAPAATSPGELVVNGWSPSKRNNAFANSGIVVSVDEKDAFAYFKKEKNKKNSPAITDPSDPLLLMKFQQAVEQNAFLAGGGKFVAPAQRLVDFTLNKLSADLPACSYLPGIHSTHLQGVLPGFVYQSLQQGFLAYGKKMKPYFTNEAVVVATESRTSSPVRIPRDPQTLQHPQLNQLYPCGEGAGYAGGIVSAAMDGEKVADRIRVCFGK
ncbi:MAG: FAD-binding protein [Bacteroidetes bacterium]|nr:FAD-binding protein [Bacteroidota bacterium]